MNEFEKAVNSKNYVPFNKQVKKAQREAYLKRIEPHWTDYLLGGLFFLLIIPMIPFVGDNGKLKKDITKIRNTKF